MGVGTRSWRLGQEDSPDFQQHTSSSHPFSHPFSRMLTGTRTERSALMMRNASLMNLSANAPR